MPSGFHRPNLLLHLSRDCKTANSGSAAAWEKKGGFIGPYFLLDSLAAGRSANCLLMMLSAKCSYSVAGQRSTPPAP